MAAIARPSIYAPQTRTKWYQEFVGAVSLTPLIKPLARLNALSAEMELFNVTSSVMEAHVAKTAPSFPKVPRAEHRLVTAIWLKFAMDPAAFALMTISNPALLSAAKAAAIVTWQNSAPELQQPAPPTSLCPVTKCAAP
jgi:hypothetical protein